MCNRPSTFRSALMRYFKAHSSVYTCVKNVSYRKHIFRKTHPQTIYLQKVVSHQDSPCDEVYIVLSNIFWWKLDQRKQYIDQTSCDILRLISILTAVYTIKTEHWRLSHNRSHGIRSYRVFLVVINKSNLLDFCFYFWDIKWEYYFYKNA